MMMSKVLQYSKAASSLWSRTSSGAGRSCRCRYFATCQSTTTTRRSLTTKTTTKTTKKASSFSSAYDPDKEKICIVGSGNFGSAMATIIGKNAEVLPFVNDRVNMWVYEEMVNVGGGEDGQEEETQKLSQVINERHENIKYLPGYKLPTNVVAIPDLQEACADATLLVFVLPHTFLPNILGTIQTTINESTNRHGLQQNCRGISLIKAMDFDAVRNRPVRVTEVIEQGMGGPDSNFHCGVMMGPNVAKEVAAGYMCESTLASRYIDTMSSSTNSSGDGMELNERTRLLLHRNESFRVRHIHDVAGAEACGALKNVYALGSGFVDGLGCGGNTKASLLRVGLHEIKSFCRLFFHSDHYAVQDSTFTESCGVADLITTCYGGRNRKCAEEFAKQKQLLVNEGMSVNPSKCHDLWNTIEHDLLQGQKLQGTHTVQDVYRTLQSHNALDQFPLLSTIYNIAFDEYPIEAITDGIRAASHT